MRVAIRREPTWLPRKTAIVLPIQRSQIGVDAMARWEATLDSPAPVIRADSVTYREAHDEYHDEVDR
jgi:hypothetical protein